MRSFILTCVCIGLLAFQGKGQEDKISAAAAEFFTSFQKRDSMAMSRQFVDPATFLHYFSSSYTLGTVNDTLKKSIEYSRRGLYESWMKDVMICHKKAVSFYKIKWENIEQTEYTVEYLERSNAGFLFKSYQLTITFVHKKKSYKILLDSFIFADGHPAILANSFILSQVK